MMTEYTQVDTWARPEYSPSHLFQQVVKGKFENQVLVILCLSSITNPATLLTLAEGLGQDGTLILSDCPTDKPIQVQAVSLAMALRLSLLVFPKIPNAPYPSRRVHGRLMIDYEAALDSLVGWMPTAECSIVKTVWDTHVIRREFS